MNKITILGCGPSQGVPQPFGGYGDCDSRNPKNMRTRCSSLLDISGDKFLIDAGPDLRQHMLKHFFLDAKAIFFTHTHADHCHGIDDLRNICMYQQKSIPIYGDQEMIAELEKRFDYSIQRKNDNASLYRPRLIPHYVKGNFMVGKHEFSIFRQCHGFSNSYGFRYKNIAYSTDLVSIPEESEQFLYDLDYWLVDCYQLKKHATHSHLEQTLGWIEKFKPKKAILIHLGNACDYDYCTKHTPDHVDIAYDNMEIIF